MKKGFFSQFTVISIIIAHIVQILYIPSALAKDTNEEAIHSISKASSAYLSHSIQQWFSQYGTAEIKTGYSFEYDNFETSSIDLLLPIYDEQNHTIFTQLGYRYEDSTDTLNFGVGYRLMLNESLLGANIFYDRDMRGNHDRFGIGAEYFRDFMRLTTNGYLRLSDWRDVDSTFRQFNNDAQLQARAANGFDMVFDAYHPDYPKVGMNLRYEQYFGESVSLFRNQSLQSDPYGVTLGVNYTPIPLMTWQIEHTEGKQGYSDTKGSLALTYRFGIPVSEQLDPNKVRQLRSFQAGKYDLVKRNPLVTLQYREKPNEINAGVNRPELVQAIDIDVIKDRALSNGIATNQVRVMLRDNDNVPLSDITVRLTHENQDILGVASSNDDGYAYFDISSTESGLFTVTAMVIGNDKITASTALTFVDESIISQAQLTLDVIKSQAVADGRDEVMLNAQLLDVNEEPISGIWLDLFDKSNNFLLSAQTHNDGTATFRLSSIEPGLVEVYAKVSGSLPALRSEHKTVFFKGDPASAALLYLNVLEDNAVANGIADNIVEAILLDERNQLMPYVEIVFKDELDEIYRIETNEDGRAQLRVTSIVAGPKTIWASVVQNPSIEASQVVIFRAVPNEIRLNVTAQPVLANGEDSHTLIAKVLDFNQDPIEGINVDFVDESGAILIDDNGDKLVGLTDESGEATQLLSSTKVKTITLKAIVDESNISSNLETISFIADNRLAIVAEATPLSSTLIADGIDKTDVKVVITDTFGNRIANLSNIIVTDDRGNDYSGNPFQTDLNGEFIIPIEPSFVVGALNLTVTLPNGAIGMAVIEFLQDYTNAYISLSADQIQILSNGVDTTLLRGKLLNQYGYPIANEPITLSDTRGWQSSITQTDEIGEFIATDYPPSSLSISPFVLVKMDRDEAVNEVIQISFNGDVNSAQIVNVQVDKSEMIANSEDTANITAKVVDKDNNPVVGQIVKFTGENEEPIGEAFSDSSGNAVAVFFASTGDLKVLRPLGTYLIEASMTNSSGNTSTGQAVVNLISSLLDIRIDRLSTLQAPIIGRPTWFEYRVTDRFGNPVFIDETLSYRIIKGHDNSSPDAVEGIDYAFVNHIPVNEQGIADLVVMFNQPGPYRITIQPPIGTTGTLDVIVLEQ
ncbi:inverse autotransporter beta domain-containing protein [Thorsellia anophelis]|uniref:Ig-like domain (Group 1) n=1 Tax=Thorsellia anophelis DSM 18579 TaxID=1123402 RepID=A0A1I0AY57_9GAMM|nr:inverse autotransporter beta domain-containing protein [Thorsellia anophelis]SES98565.1 Ig-like domain (group 1) [Thorsellia anophelis DSM 18579]